jgi:type VI secretion system secreted protein VgrG
MNRLYRTLGPLAAILLFAALFFVAFGSTKSNATGRTAGANPTAPALSSAKSYVVLGASAVTNTGGTAIRGDLGVSSPGISPTGFPPGSITGTIHSGDASSAQAQGNLTPAYNSLAAKTCATSLTGQDLGGRTLTQGVYCFTSSAQLTGKLTLAGNAKSVYIFKIASALNTASNSSVVMTGGSLARNVYWQVGSSASLGTGTAFKGNILALTSISLATGASLSGRALARNGAVTMDGNAISMP